MNGERLELVTDFASLRAGMIVVIKGCGLCGGEHRGMLLSPVADPDWGTVFPKVPISWCRPRWVTMCGANKDTVAVKIVYRVVDGLESSLPTSTKKRTPKREGVR